MIRTRLALAAALAISLLASGPAQSQDLQFHHRITGADGSPVANHRVSPELAAAVEGLPGVVVVGDPEGDVTLAEFYDVNCPYCRRASSDLDALLRSDSNLKVVLVPFPVLGIPSIQAGRVELAIRKISTPRKFYEFHRKLYEGRGVIDGSRALAVARNLGFDQERILAEADQDGITQTMKAHVKLGNALGLAATPSYVVGNVAIVGHPGQRSLHAIVAAMRQCGKVTC
jgi:protein-disulfide isomerase